MTNPPSDSVMRVDLELTAHQEGDIQLWLCSHEGACKYISQLH